MTRRLENRSNLPPPIRSAAPTPRFLKATAVIKASAVIVTGRTASGRPSLPSLIDHLVDYDAFREVVLSGRVVGASAMREFADDPNVAPYIDAIYAYLQARSDGALGRGRPPDAKP